MDGWLSRDSPGTATVTLVYRDTLPRGGGEVNGWFSWDSPGNATVALAYLPRGGRWMDGCSGTATVALVYRDILPQGGGGR